MFHEMETKQSQTFKHRHRFLDEDWGVREALYYVKINKMHSNWIPIYNFNTKFSNPWQCEHKNSKKKKKNCNDLGTVWLNTVIPRSASNVMERALQCSRWTYVMQSQRFIQVHQYLWVPPTKTFLKLHWQINIQIILWYKKVTKL